MKTYDCWVCGEPGAVMERTLLGFKRPVCPPGQGLCGQRRTPRKTRKNKR